MWPPAKPLAPRPEAQAQQQANSTAQNQTGTVNILGGGAPFKLLHFKLIVEASSDQITPHSESIPALNLRVPHPLKCKGASLADSPV